MSRNIYLPDDDYAVRYFQSGTWKRACRRVHRKVMFEALLIFAASCGAICAALWTTGAFA